MQHANSLAVLARADSHKGDPVSMSRVHIRLNLKNETGHLFFSWPYLALFALTIQRRRRIINEFIQQLFDAEVTHRRPKEYWRLFCGKIILEG